MSWLYQINQVKENNHQTSKHWFHNKLSGYSLLHYLWYIWYSEVQALHDQISRLREQLNQKLEADTDLLKLQVDYSKMRATLTECKSA